MRRLVQHRVEPAVLGERRPRQAVEHDLALAEARAVRARASSAFASACELHLFDAVHRQAVLREGLRDHRHDRVEVGVGARRLALRRTRVQAHRRAARTRALFDGHPVVDLVVGVVVRVVGRVLDLDPVAGVARVAGVSAVRRVPPPFLVRGLPRRALGFAFEGLFVFLGEGGEAEGDAQLVDACHALLRVLCGAVDNARAVAVERLRVGAALRGVELIGREREALAPAPRHRSRAADGTVVANGDVARVAGEVDAHAGLRPEVRARGAGGFVQGVDEVGGVLDGLFVHGLARDVLGDGAFEDVHGGAACVNVRGEGFELLKGLHGPEAITGGRGRRGRRRRAWRGSRRQEARCEARP